MPLITLTTDMGSLDHYVAVVKAAIYRHLPEAVIVDVSHHVRPFDVSHAALLLRSSYRDFPKGTIHIIGVLPERSALIEHLVVQHDGHYFIGADNGMFPLISDKVPQRIFDLSHVAASVPDSGFPVRDAFALAACHLAKGGTLEILGRPATIRNHGTSYQPAILDDAIRGVAVYVDVYGNVITNIDRAVFDAVRRDRQFEIRFRKERQRAKKINRSYTDVDFAEVALLFGSSGFLEIAINGGNASQLLGIKPKDTITVEFL
jgi:S-adenosyl-L-methionine hydrolase (adenosine-forming)